MQFAKIENNIVVNLIVVDEKECLDSNGDVSESVGALFCSSLEEGKWLLDSIHKNTPQIGGSYSVEGDAFYETERPDAFDSWVLNTTTFVWEAPVTKPDGLLEGEYADWDEATLSWNIVEID